MLKKQLWVVANDENSQREPQESKAVWSQIVMGCLGGGAREREDSWWLPGDGRLQVHWLLHL